MKIIHLVGARPNFIKAAPLISALASYPDIQQQLVHTGQHYDANMSAVFFQQLGLPEPDANLGVGSGSNAWQTAQIMMKFEAFALEANPDLVLVYGDVNSTVAAALVCAKIDVRLGHVEAGLRSFDRSMPEEINRLLTDQLADLLFTPSLDANENLLREGISSDKIHFVGNIMIDTLVRLLPQAAKWTPSLRDMYGLNGAYGLVTLHRAGNVDEPEKLRGIVAALAQISTEIPLLFPVHPRTRQRLQAVDLKRSSPALQLIEPLSYMEFLGLMQQARLVITDSGGLQEETTYLGVPCLTLRPNTERPVTLTAGTNRLITGNGGELLSAAREILVAPPKRQDPPEFWDGKTARRIAEIISTSIDTWKSRADLQPPNGSLQQDVRVESTGM